MISVFFNEFVPPGLGYRTDIVVCTNFLEIPYSVGIGIKIMFIGGI